jgi:adenylate kinase family enzyme
VVGTAGSGKTTVARRLSAGLGLRHVELDHLRYESDWREVPDDVFLRSASDLAATDEWITDGNYAVVRNVLWGRAQLVVWLDLPLIVVLARIVRRSMRRLWSREDLGNDNRERLGRLVGPRSIILWAIRSHAPLREEYERKSRQAARDGLAVARIRSTSAEHELLTAAEGGTLAAFVARTTGRP